MLGPHLNEDHKFATLEREVSIYVLHSLVGNYVDYKVNCCPHNSTVEHPVFTSESNLHFCAGIVNSGNNILQTVYRHAWILHGKLDVGSHSVSPMNCIK